MEHKRISQEFEAMNDIETDICNFLIWGKDDNEYDKRLTSAWRKQEKWNDVELIKVPIQM